LPAIANTSRPSNPYIGSLIGEYRWASGILTYGFPSSASFYETSYGHGEPASLGALTLEQQNAAHLAFYQYAAVANLTFSQLTAGNAGQATLRIAMSDKPGTAYAYLPTTLPEGGDVWLNKRDYISPARGNYDYITFIHEIGHALGLTHPHEGSAPMPLDRDSMEYTVMSYKSYEHQSASGYTNDEWSFAQTLMMYDIAAVQSMYGANFATNSGNTVYSWSPTTGQMFINGTGQNVPGANKIFQTVWDGGGSDTYDFWNYTSNLSIDLRPGQWTTLSFAQLADLNQGGPQMADGNIANALLFADDPRSLIENAVGGSGNDRIVGNAANNKLVGGAGSDVLRGEAGNDSIDGSGGFDTAEWQGVLADYQITRQVSGAIKVVHTNGGDGTDLVTGVEQLSFGGTVYSAESLAPVATSTLVLSAFGVQAGGWQTNQQFPRELGDMNGDGVADIIAFGNAGVHISLGNGQGSFNSPYLSLSQYGAGQGAGGWTSANQFPRMAADVNGDGRDDIVGFGNAGVYVTLSQPNNTWASTTLALNAFGTVAGSWSDNDRFPRELADVNGDNLADVVGFGNAGVYVALADGRGGFAAPRLALGAFGAMAGGWGSQDKFPRYMADVNGDGRSDVVGFGNAGVYVALADGNGAFTTPFLASNSFGATAGGWTSNDRFPRSVVDVNGDGRADIVGFGSAGVYASLGQANGTFGPMQFSHPDFGTDKGWASQNVTPRHLADVTGDGVADVVGFGENGVFVGSPDFLA
jgi:serralysin